MAALSAVPVAAGVFLWLPQLAVGAILGAAGTAVAVAAVDRWQAEVPVLEAAQSRPAGPAARTPKPPLDEPGPAALSVAPVAPQAPVRPSAPEPSAQSTSASAGRELPLPTQSTLDQELALLEEARRLLATDAAGALRVLQSHEARFVGGQLRIEREFLAVETLVRLGRGHEAEARARALEVQAPRTIYGERLDRILGRAKR